MKRNINSRTITLKIPNRFTYEKEARIKHDALFAIFVSPNPLRSDYNLNDKEYELVQYCREEIELLLVGLEEQLKLCEKGEG